MKYIVTTPNAEGEATEVATRSNKAKAIEIAQAHRDENRVAVTVTTDKGTVVLELAAPKKIRMSPKFSRTADLPEGVEAPEGLRVAYVRARAGFAVLVDDELRTSDNEDAKPYSLLNLKSGKRTSGRFATTREAGHAMTERFAARKAREAEAAQESETPTPESTPEPANA